MSPRGAGTAGHALQQSTPQPAPDHGQDDRIAPAEDAAAAAAATEPISGGLAGAAVAGELAAIRAALDEMRVARVRLHPPPAARSSIGNMIVSFARKGTITAHRGVIAWTCR